jgi:large subunit ribosomal protein L15
VRRLQHLRPARGAVREPKRRGCGDGTGIGGTAGKGHKGQRARGKIQRRLTHRGFSNVRFARVYQVVNIGMLGRFSDDTVVTPEELKGAGLISSRLRPVKILGEGSLSSRITVCAHAFSRSAAEAITGAGGAVEVLD